jgi:hypothetical protein
LRSAKVSKTLLPHHSVPRLGSACPHSGIAPWARREGPSMVQRGYPGIHAGMPTAQCLRSASVVNGAPRSTSAARRPDSRPGSCGGYTHQTCLSWTCRSKACSRGGLIADLLLRGRTQSNCGSGLARESGGSVCGDVGCADTFASKPAPTGFVSFADAVNTRKPMWERACSR